MKAIMNQCKRYPVYILPYMYMMAFDLPRNYHRLSREGLYPLMRQLQSYHWVMKQGL